MPNPVISDPSSVDDGAAPAPGESGCMADPEQLPLFPFDPGYHAMLSLVGDGVVSLDRDGRIVLFNRAAEEMFGYDRDEVLGRPLDLLMPAQFHERHRQDFAEFCSSLVPLRRSMGAEREVMARRKNGEEWAVEATLSRQMIGGHAIVTAVVRDVSYRRRTELQRQLVANEVAHRLRNTMTVVNAVVALTARSAASVSDFKEALLGRLAAIARTNAYLTNGMATGADLRVLLVSELAAFDEGDRITLTGPDVSLGGAIAVPLALVIHELATNAAKHGSLSGTDGSLRLDWQVATAETPILRLVWSEISGPDVAAPCRRGFGTGLISRILGGHGGSAELDFEVSGVTCTIVLPLA